MSWENNLQTASFRGVQFDVLRTRDARRRSTAHHEYPYIDGADIEDMGAGARRCSLVAVFWGDDYDDRLRTFLQALDTAGSGELIHPVFGSIANAQLDDYEVEHDADNPDHCLVHLRFDESTPSNPFFVKQLPAQQAQSIGALAAAAQSGGFAAFANAIAAVKSGMQELNALRAVVTGTLGAIRTQVQGVIGTALDLINYPQAFAADVMSCLSGIADLRDFDGDTIAAEWKGLASQFSTIVELPSSINDGTASVDTATGVMSVGVGGSSSSTTTTSSGSGSSSGGGSSGGGSSSGGSSGDGTSAGGTSGTGSSGSGSSGSGSSGSGSSGSGSSGSGSSGGSSSDGSSSGSGSSGGGATPGNSIAGGTAMPLVPAAVVVTGASGYDAASTVPASFSPAGANEADVALVETVVRLAAALQLAQTASDILIAEYDDPTLSPPDIEQIVSDTRTAIEATIVQHRSVYATPTALPIVDALKSIALAVQTAGINAIEAQPALTTRAVDAPANLTLLAFQWYGDYTRADELARLNPSIRNPNFVLPGTVLNAYAS
ncbi:DNA circularization protein [Paraburkholderia unamae]|uniref:Prophage DNA circulation protein n=1 Tax=Paraburkholderia unamae TaxID=219649 RepID=A0ABX5KHY2_9BURK|nr:DNA circularization N-terminal domain-containing protein [Paraburkholderia unamae]PVX80057.1 prophage DNA circulation protein [Paraburkholderia unamae]